MGDEVKHAPGFELVAEFPAPCAMRLLKNGEEIRRSEGSKLAYTPDGPGVYHFYDLLKRQPATSRHLN